MNTIPRQIMRWMPPLALVGAVLFGSTSAAGAFVHPGGLHTQADLDRIKAQVAAGAHPWIDSCNLLIADAQAQKPYSPHAQAEMSNRRQKAGAAGQAPYPNARR